MKRIRGLGRKTLVLITLSLLVACGAEDTKEKYMQRGLESVAKEDWDKARIEFKNVLSVDPKDIESRYQLALVLEKVQDWRSAFANYNAVLSQDENHVGAITQLAKLHLVAKQYQESNNYVERLVTLVPDSVDIPILKSSLAMAAGDKSQALTYAAAAYQQDASYADAALVFATMLIDQKRLEEAEKILLKAMEDNPRRLSIHTILGQLYVNAERHDEALAMFEKMAEVRPDSHEIKTRMIAYLSRIGRKEEAEQRIRRLIKEDPKTVEHKFVLVDFIKINQGLEQAEQTLKDFVEEAPKNYELRMGLARFYLGNKQLPQAKAVLEQVVKGTRLNKQGLNARVELAKIFASEKDFAGFENMLEEVLEESPRNAQALSLRGKFYVTQQQFDLAIADFRTILADAPTDNDALHFLAKAQVLNKQASLAQDNYKKLLQLDPGNAKVRQELARVHQLLGDLDGAIKQYEMARQLADDESLQRKLITLYINNGDSAKADELIARFSETQDNQVLANYYLGLNLRQQGKLQASIEKFEQSLAEAPKAVEPMTALVQSMLELKKPAMALKRLQQAQAVRGSDPILHNLLGDVQAVLEDYKAALASYEQASQLRANWWRPYRGMAASYLRQGQAEQAIAAFKRGIEQSQEKLQLQNDLALLFQREHRYEEAMLVYEAMLNHQPQNIVASNNLAMLLISHRTDKSSLERAQELVKTFEETDNANLLDTIGWTYYKNGDYQTAVRFLTKAKQLEPRVAVLNYHLGMTYLAMGERQRAKGLLEQALQAEVDFNGLDEAKSALASL